MCHCWLIIPCCFNEVVLMCCFVNNFDEVLIFASFPETASASYCEILLFSYAMVQRVENVLY